MLEAKFGDDPLVDMNKYAENCWLCSALRILLSDSTHKNVTSSLQKAYISCLQEVNTYFSMALMSDSTFARSTALNTWNQNKSH